MKRSAIAVCVVVLVFAVASIAQTPAKPKSASVEQELIKLENSWNDAMVKHDWAFLEQILAADYTGTSSDGIVSTKAQEIATLKSGDSVVKYAVGDDFKVRIYGDVAVVTFLYTSKGESKGKDTSGQFRITDTWVKHAGRWQCVADHASKIAQK
jgi:ketosteroid isomerase-like protein